jgi:hypothetical protein
MMDVPQADKRHRGIRAADKRQSDANEEKNVLHGVTSNSLG